MATTDKKSILRVLREKFKYTQEEVSQYLGISQPAYLKYEMGYTDFAYAFRRDGMANLEEVAHFQQLVKNYIMMSDELEKDR